MAEGSSSAAPREPRREERGTVPPRPMPPSSPPEGDAVRSHSAAPQAPQDLVKFFWENRQTSAARALHDVMTERYRQVMVEGWTAKHDDEHSTGSMAIAAACYALADREAPLAVQTVRLSKLWEWTGWAAMWWKPKERRRNLVRAAALLLAEIEREDRARSLAQPATRHHSA